MKYKRRGNEIVEAEPLTYLVRMITPKYRGVETVEYTMSAEDFLKEYEPVVEEEKPIQWIIKYRSVSNAVPNWRRSQNVNSKQLFDDYGTAYEQAAREQKSMAEDFEYKVFLYTGEDLKIALVNDSGKQESEEKPVQWIIKYRGSALPTCWLRSINPDTKGFFDDYAAALKAAKKQRERMGNHGLEYKVFLYTGENSEAIDYDDYAGFSK